MKKIMFSLMLTMALVACSKNSDTPTTQLVAFINASASGTTPAYWQISTDIHPASDITKGFVFDDSTTLTISGTLTISMNVVTSGYPKSVPLSGSIKVNAGNSATGFIISSSKVNAGETASFTGGVTACTNTKYKF